VVGNTLIDMGSRVPFLRRHVLEPRHPGPVPQAAAPGGSSSSNSSSSSLLGMGLPVGPRRQLSSRSIAGGLSSSSSSSAARGGHHYTLMEGNDDEEAAGSP
jgi:hypothetical protein